ncbi:MAG: hypothetical protein R3C51_08280 [Parvularculaceae bacterium]
MGAGFRIAKTDAGIFCVKPTPGKAQNFAAPAPGKRQRFYRSNSRRIFARFLSIAHGGAKRDKFIKTEKPCAFLAGIFFHKSRGIIFNKTISAGKFEYGAHYRQCSRSCAFSACRIAAAPGTLFHFRCFSGGNIGLHFRKVSNSQPCNGAPANKRAYMALNASHIVCVG